MFIDLKILGIHAQLQVVRNIKFNYSTIPSQEGMELHARDLYKSIASLSVHQLLQYLVEVYACQFIKLQLVRLGDFLIQEG